MRTKQFIFTVILCCISIFSIKGEIKKEYHIEKDGFEWYEITDEALRVGAQNKLGEYIIPLKYLSIRYEVQDEIDDSYFLVSTGKSKMVYDKRGRVIISSSTGTGHVMWFLDKTRLGYRYFNHKNTIVNICGNVVFEGINNSYDYVDTKAFYEEGKFFIIALVIDTNDMLLYGVVDANENIVVPFKYSKGIEYKNGDFITCDDDWKEVVIGNVDAVKSTDNPFVGGTVNNPDRKVSAGATQTTSTSERSDSSDDDGLLYKGMYSCDGQGYDTYSGQSFFSDLVAGNYEMTISENDLHWNFYTAFYKYTTKNGTRVYEESNGLAENVFYVSPSYNVYFTSTMSSWMGTTTYRYNLKKGQSTYSPQSNNSSSYSNNSSNSYNSSTSSPSSTQQKRWRNVTRTETCPSCHGTGKCWTCNGKGYYNNPYGTGTVSCSNCNNGRCRKCGGSGTITKTEQVYE